MITEKATPELYAALSAAQGEIGNAAKNADNPHFKSRYADLGEVLNTIRPAFAKHGLAIIQSTACDGATVSVTTVIAHKAGGEVSSTASCIPRKYDPQGVGDATTYLRRYGASAMAGISQEDDDGNRAAAEDKPAAYDDAQFAKNLPAWREAIAEGKRTADEIIAMVETRGKLSGAQMAMIRKKADE